MSKDIDFVEHGKELMPHNQLRGDAKSDGDAQQSDPKISAIWTYSAGEPGSQEALHEYSRAVSALKHRCELIVVMNGGAGQRHDGLIEKLQNQHVLSRIVALHRECDEWTTYRAGIEASRGELLALLPPYLQTDPHSLAEMLVEIERGADLVTSWRYPRVDSRWNSFKSYVFNAITRLLTGVTLHDLNSGLRVIRRSVTEQVPVYGDLYRFLPVLADLQGFRVAEVQVRHLEERSKRGDYRIGVYIRRMFDLLTLFFLFKFTQKPLRFFGLIGSTTLSLGAILSSVVVIQRWFGDAMADRPAMLLGVMLIVLGVQLVSFGLLGELIIFTYGRQLGEQHVEQIYERRNQQS